MSAALEPDTAPAGPGSAAAPGRAAAEEAVLAALPVSLGEVARDPLAFAVWRVASICCFASGDGSWSWDGGYETLDLERRHFSGQFHPGGGCEPAPSAPGRRSAGAFVCCWCGTVVY